MIADKEIKIKGIEALINKLGEVEAERFIALLIRKPFDYTQLPIDHPIPSTVLICLKIIPHLLPLFPIQPGKTGLRIDFRKPHSFIRTHT